MTEPIDPETFRKLFPNATASAIRRVEQSAVGRVCVSPSPVGEAPKLERDIGHGAVGALQVQGGLGKRFLVRVKAFRRRLLDEDNLCEKYHVDLLRYAGVIPSDAPGTTRIEVSQEKVGSKEQETVLLEVYEI